MSKNHQVGYKKWMPHNLEVIKKKCTYYLENVKEKELVSMLKKVAESTIDYIEKMTSLPHYTGNLHDATGVGVYVNGKLAAYSPKKTATRMQHSGFHNTYETNIDGSVYLQNTLSDASADFSKGIWLVVFSAVPYAFYIQDRDKYFSELTDHLLSEIYAGLVQLKPKNIPNLNRYDTL